MGRSHSKENDTPAPIRNYNNGSSNSLNNSRSNILTDFGHMQPKSPVTHTDPSLILEPFLYLGSAYGMRNTKLLDYLGITHVLNMAVELPMNPDLYSDRFKFIHILADDSYTYNIRKDFELAFQLIDDARATGGKVLVHCK
jgi:hypothetical protein